MKTINVSEETYEKIKEQLTDGESPINTYEDMVGQKFFFRTVTYHSVGKVVKFVGDFIELETASWVADSGRFMDAIKSGSLNEVELVGAMFVNIKSIVDFFPWKHDLPTEQK